MWFKNDQREPPFDFWRCKQFRFILTVKNYLEMEKLKVKPEFLEKVIAEREKFESRIGALRLNKTTHLACQDLLEQFKEMEQKFESCPQVEWFCFNCDKIVPMEHVESSEFIDIHSISARGCGGLVYPIE
jgi:hypothetical protein